MTCVMGDSSHECCLKMNVFDKHCLCSLQEMIKLHWFDNNELHDVKTGAQDEQIYKQVMTCHRTSFVGMTCTEHGDGSGGTCRQTFYLCATQ